MVSSREIGILALLGLGAFALSRGLSSNVFASQPATPLLSSNPEILGEEEIETPPPVTPPLELTRVQKLVRLFPDQFFSDSMFNPIRQFVGQRCFNCGATPTFTREFNLAKSFADLSSGVQRVVSTRAIRAGFKSDVLFFNFSKGFLNKQLDEL